MSIQCVAFDIDDTLYLERDYVRSGLRSVGDWWRQHIGHGDFCSLAWNCFERGVRGQIFNEIIAVYNMHPEPDLIRQMVRVYREHKPEISLLPDAEQCLKRLRLSMNLAIVTDGPAPSQRAKINALKLEERVDLIMVTSEHGEGLEKPNPYAFERVMQELSLSPAQCAYVADNPEKDFVAPLALGWKAIRIKRPGALYYEAPVPVHAEQVPTVSTLDRLEECL